MLSFSGSLKVFVALKACDMRKGFNGQHALVIECCRRRGLNPFAYLRDVLTRLPNMTNHQIPEVTPAAWQKSQKQLHLIA